MMNDNNVLGPIAALLSSVTWSIGSGLYARLSAKHSGFKINGTRALFGIVSFGLAQAIVSQSFGEFKAAFAPIQFLNIAWLSLSTLASYAFADFLFFKSSTKIGLSSSLAVASIYPLWTTLAAVLYLGEPATTTKVMGVVMIVFGVILVVVGTPEVLQPQAKIANAKIPDHQFPEANVTNDLRTKRRWTGFSLAFLTSILWSLNTVSVYRGSFGLEPFVTNTLRMSLAFAFCGLFERGLPLIRIENPLKVLPIFFIEVFGGSLFYVYAMKHANLATAAALSSLAPVIAACFELAQNRFRIRSKKELQRLTGIFVVIGGIWTLVGFI